MDACDERLQNDIFCVGWDVKPHLNQSVSLEKPNSADLGLTLMNGMPNVTRGMEVKATQDRVSREVCMSLCVQIRNNQGVPKDKLTTPPPPTFVPPILFIAPWLFEVSLIFV